MKLCIPSVGDTLMLTSEWQFTLVKERRNLGFWNQVVIAPKSTRELVSLPKGTTLKVDRIYIRQGVPEMDSVTFRIVGQKNSRFWVSRSDANKIEFQEPERPAEYRIQNCYQDGHWEDLADEVSLSWEAAIRRAGELCKDSIVYGMTRVIDQTGRVLVTYPAGGY